MKEGGDDADSLTVMPTFMGGGLDKFRAWFIEEFDTSSIIGFTEIKIILKFSVDTEGFVDNVEIVECNDLEMAQQAVELVRNSPQWTPGIRGEEAVRTHFLLPITIKIEIQHTPPQSTMQGKRS